jgi:hypothetical protein
LIGQRALFVMPRHGGVGTLWAHLTCGRKQTSAIGDRRFECEMDSINIGHA